MMLPLPCATLVDADADSASGAVRILDELLRYTMPVPVRGFAACPSMGDAGGEVGDRGVDGPESCAEVSEGVRRPRREVEDCCCDEEEEGMEGTGTAARSPLARAPAWRGSWSGRTAAGDAPLPLAD